MLFPDSIELKYRSKYRVADLGLRSQAYAFHGLFSYKLLIFNLFSNPSSGHSTLGDWDKTVDSPLNSCIEPATRAGYRRGL